MSDQACHIHRFRARFAWAWAAVLVCVVVALAPGAMRRDRRVTEAAYTAAILEAVDYAVIICDRELKVTHFTGGAERLLGVDAEQVVGKSARWMIPDELLPAHDAAVERFWQSDRTDPWVIHCGALDYHGQSFRARMRISPVRLTDGQWRLVVQMEREQDLATIDLP